MRYTPKKVAWLVLTLIAIDTNIGNVTYQTPWWFQVIGATSFTAWALWTVNLIIKD